MRTMLAAAALMAGSCSVALAQPSAAICGKVLEFGRTVKLDVKVADSRSAYYRAFCGEQYENEASHRQRATSIGVPVTVELPNIEYKDTNSKANTREFSLKVCEDMRAGRMDNTQMLSYVSAINQHVENIARQCIDARGLVAWGEFDPDVQGAFLVRMRYTPSNSEGGRGRGYRFINAASTGSESSFDIHPTGAVKECTGKPMLGQVLEPNRDIVVTCHLNPDFKGGLVSTSANVEAVGGFWSWITGKWRDPQPVQLPANVTIVKPVPPPPPPKAAPLLVFQRTGVAPIVRPIGEWMEVDMAQPRTHQDRKNWEYFALPASSLRIDDFGGVLPPGQRILAGLRTRFWLGRNPYGAYSGDLQEVPIRRSRSDKDDGATLAGFTHGWTPRPHIESGTGQADGMLTFDTSGAPMLAVEAQMVSPPHCSTKTMATSTAQPKIEMHIPIIRSKSVHSGGAVSQCLVRMRLCAMPSYPQFSESNACTVTSGPLARGQVFLAAR